VTPYAPLTLREGGAAVLLTEVDPRITDVTIRERWRSLVSSHGVRLRRDLGLREAALQLDETPDGPALRVSGVAGTLRVGSSEIDVAPKHVQGLDESNWRRALIAMMERAARRRADFSLSDRLELGHGSFSDYFAYTFAVALEYAQRREPVRLYVSQREESRVLRGRLLVTEQLRSTLTKPHVLVCEVDRLDPDNPVNRLLRWAGTTLLGLARDGRVRRLLSHHLSKLPDVTSVRPPLPLRATLPRQFAHYSTAVELAVALAHAEGPHAQSSADQGSGFLVGTERMFEQFIERSLAAVASHAPWEAVPQARELFATPEPPNPGRRFDSKPDNIIQIDGTTELVVDAKYKRFEDATEETRGSRPTNGDLYQVAAAAVAHHCNRGLLLYPRLSTGDAATTAPIRWWRVDAWADEPIRIGVATVDLEILGERGGMANFDEVLRQRIDEALL
jgi:5-methylcytosine-specific restriction endonuclease McrBC regulatory subunit McrC